LEFQSIYWGGLFQERREKEKEEVYFGMISYILPSVSLL
jgi:hypothetical protein